MPNSNASKILNFHAYAARFNILIIVNAKIIFIDFHADLWYNLI